MEITTALAVLVQLIQTATGAMVAAQQVSELIKKAKAENRDITEEEINSIVSLDDAAKINLQKAIDASK